MKDYYQILGLPRTATKEEVKKAFHKAAHRYHPDKTGGDAEKFKEASEAYAVLSDEKKRAEYDAYGRTFSGAGGFSSQGGSASGWDFSGFSGFGEGVEFDMGDLGDMFGDIFGGRRAQARRGRDISIDVQISFKESVFGAERRMMLTKPVECGTCSGSGAKPGTTLQACTRCGGKGRMREERRTLFGTFATVITCATCGGKGEVPKEHCKECRGEGVQRRQEEITVAIPAGIEQGEMIRLSGLGEAMKGGSPGDLYVKVHVEQDKRFSKEGNNLLTALPIKVTDALLGASKELETLEGPLMVKVPAGVAHGATLRIRGKGVPERSGKRGDLLIRISVSIPTSLSKEARTLIEALKKEGL